MLYSEYYMILYCKMWDRLCGAVMGDGMGCFTVGLTQVFITRILTETCLHMNERTAELVCVTQEVSVVLPKSLGDMCETSSFLRQGASSRSIHDRFTSLNGALK